MKVIFFDDNTDYTFHSIFYMFFKMTIDVDMETSMTSNVKRETEISHNLQGMLILHIRNLPLIVAEVKDRSENEPSKMLDGKGVQQS